MHANSINNAKNIFYSKNSSNQIKLTNRCNHVKHCMVVEQTLLTMNAKIKSKKKYLDFCSLHPSVQKQNLFPAGDPHLLNF
jgi:hypothetical protein